MKSLKVILAVVIMSLGVSHLLGAQELNCSVEINTDKISGTDKKCFYYPADSHCRIYEQQPMG